MTPVYRGRGFEFMSTPLASRIFQAISEEETDSLSFADYMRFCLYEPEVGYYARPESRRLGRGGDFFTSVSVGAGFGFLLGLAVEERWKAAGKGDFLVVEQGAHDGQLARDIVAGLEERRSVLANSLHYVVHEPRPAQARALEETLEGTKIEVATAPPTKRAPRGLYLANELLDAFPVHRIRWENGEWRELRVRGGHQSGLDWVTMALSPGSRLEEAAMAIPVKDRPEGYTTEICLELESWIDDAVAWFDRGAWWVIDYGREAEDFFAPGRVEGTLRGYRNHRRCDDPFESPGEVDLTADVNFTDVNRVAAAQGLVPEPLTDQNHFLVGAAASWLRAVEAGGPAALESNRQRLRQFQTLTHPGLMGRAFKVAEFRRNTTGIGTSHLTS